MQASRSAVSAALFNLLKGCYAWVTADPRLKLSDDLAANAQPALFLVKSAENITQSGDFSMPVYTLKYHALVFIRASATPEDSGSTAEDIMDNILTAIDNAMQPILGEANTLGGLVTNAWIDGDVQIDTPVLFESCAIWVPISVKVGM
jgi:hypothetical protein